MRSSLAGGGRAPRARGETPPGRRRARTGREEELRRAPRDGSPPRRRPPRNRGMPSSASTSAARSHTNRTRSDAPDRPACAPPGPRWPGPGGCVPLSFPWIRSWEHPRRPAGAAPMSRGPGFGDAALYGWASRAIPLSTGPVSAERTEEGLRKVVPGRLFHWVKIASWIELVAVRRADRRLAAPRPRGSDVRVRARARARLHRPRDPRRGHLPAPRGAVHAARGDADPGRAGRVGDRDRRARAPRSRLPAGVSAAEKGGAGPRRGSRGPPHAKRPPWLCSLSCPLRLGLYPVQTDLTQVRRIGAREDRSVRKSWRGGAAGGRGSTRPSPPPARR